MQNTSKKNKNESKKNEIVKKKDNKLYKPVRKVVVEITKKELKERTKCYKYMEVMEEDINLSTLPFYNTGNKKLFVLRTEWDRGNDKCFLQCNSTEYVPNGFDNKVMCAIQRLWHIKIHIYVDYILTTYKEIAETMGLKYEYYSSRIIESIERLHHAYYTIQNALYSKKITQNIDIIENFHILSLKKIYNQNNKKQIILQITLNDLIKENIELGYYQNMEYKIIRELKDDISVRLYQFLQTKRNMYTDKYYVIKYDYLADRLSIHDSDHIKRRNERILEALLVLKNGKFKETGRSYNMICDIITNKDEDTLKILFHEMQIVTEVIESNELVRRIGEPSIIDIETNYYETPFNNDNIDNTKESFNLNDSEIKLYNNINKNIGELKETMFKRLIKEDSIERVEDCYKNYIIRKEKKITDKHPIGWFIASIKNKNFTYCDEFNEKKKLEEKQKQDKIDAENIKKTNKLYENDPDCFGAKNALYIVNLRNELLNLFTKEEINQLIEIKQTNPIKIDGLSIKYEYRYEVIESLYNFIFKYEEEKENIIKKLKNLLNGNEEAIQEQVFSFDINKKIQEEEDKRLEQERLKQEEILKQRLFKEQNFDEDLKDINENDYQKYYNYKLALLTILSKDEYNKIFNYKKDKLIKAKIKPVNKSIIEDIFKNLTDIKQIKLKNVIEMILDRSIDTKSLKIYQANTDETEIKNDVTYENKPYTVKEEYVNIDVKEEQEEVIQLNNEKNNDTVEEQEEIIEQSENIIEITGEQLKEAREKAGYSKVELSKLINYDQSHISKWEKNLRSIPKKLIPKIREVLKIGQK